MSDFASPLLTYPFKSDVLDWPEEALVIGAGYFSDIAEFKNIECIQSFKPAADMLGKKNILSKPVLENNKKHHSVLCVLPKQKEAALYSLAQAINTLEENGLLLSVAENDAGGKRLEKWYKDLGLNPQSLSKSKCRITWAYKENIAKTILDKCIENGSEQKIQLGNKDYFTKPGIFGWNKIDTGSQMLAETIKSQLYGVGADFGCGYGYLSDAVLSSKNSIKKIYAIDADYNALECCRKNLKQYEDKVMIEYGWEDLNTKPGHINNLDWIIMNPPFHDGKASHVSVGQNFITTAAQSLRKGGILYMVANAHLPYEKILESDFTKLEKIEEKQGFKVYKATR